MAANEQSPTLLLNCDARLAVTGADAAKGRSVCTPNNSPRHNLLVKNGRFWLDALPHLGSTA